MLQTLPQGIPCLGMKDIQMASPKRGTRLVKQFPFRSCVSAMRKEKQRAFTIGLWRARKPSASAVCITLFPSPQSETESLSAKQRQQRQEDGATELDRTY